MLDAKREKKVESNGNQKSVEKGKKSDRSRIRDQKCRSKIKRGKEERREKKVDSRCQDGYTTPRVKCLRRRRLSALPRHGSRSVRGLSCHGQGPRGRIQATARSDEGQTMQPKVRSGVSGQSLNAGSDQAQALVRPGPDQGARASPTELGFRPGSGRVLKRPDQAQAKVRQRSSGRTELKSAQCQSRQTPPSSIISPLETSTLTPSTQRQTRD